MPDLYAAYIESTKEPPDVEFLMAAKAVCDAHARGPEESAIAETGFHSFTDDEFEEFLRGEGPY